MTLREQIAEIHTRCLGKELTENRRNNVPAMCRDLVEFYFDHAITAGSVDLDGYRFWLLPETRDLRALTEARRLISEGNLRADISAVE